MSYHKKILVLRETRFMSCVSEAVMRFCVPERTIPRLSPRARTATAETRECANHRSACCHRQSISDSHLSTPGTPWEEVVAMGFQISACNGRLPAKHLVGRGAWKICRRLVCFGGESKKACCSRAAERVEFRALLSRVSACRAEGGRRFARVHPPAARLH